MRALWLPAVLRLAGLDVVELRGWETRGSEFDDIRALVWHHDGSPIGDSPGVPAYMAGQIDRGKPGAQLWVDRYGVWHIVASGAVAHAGRVLAGKPGNPDSLGVETDATTNEPHPGSLLASLRLGTAACLRHLDQAPKPGLEFHKTICSPVGRKSDPWGLSLTTERRAVMALLKEDDMPAPKHTTAVVPAPAGGWWRLEADGGVHCVDGAPFFGSRFTLAPEHQRFSPDEWFVGLVPLVSGSRLEGYALVTNHGDSYRFGAG